jgi:hypothetical protein
MRPPFERARDFLPSPEMRAARLLQEYFEEVATDAITRFDALNFLQVAAASIRPYSTHSATLPKVGCRRW